MDFYGGKMSNRNLVEAYKVYKKAEEKHFGEYAYKGGEDRHE